MARPKRTFSADPGQFSVGTAGPDQIEYDLDNLFNMLDPNTLLNDGSPGGIGPENLRSDYQVDQSQSPSSNTGRLDILLGRLANRIKAIIGLADWKNNPPTTLKDAKDHMNNTALHSGLASLDGVSNPGGNVDLIAGTGIAIAADNEAKTIQITATGTAAPAAHATTHAANGTDPVTPASIGAETPAGAQEKVNAHAANPSAHHRRYTDAEAVAAIKAADGHGSLLDADTVDGCEAGTGPNNVLKLDENGKVPASCLPPIQPIQQRFLYYGDETECSATGTAETSIKTLRVVKCSTAGFNVAKLYFVATLKVSGGTGYLKVYVDGVLAATLQTTSTGYVVVSGSATVSWSDNTVHTIEARISNSGAYVTYNQVFEVYVE